MMKARRFLAGFVLLILLGVGIAGLYLTSNAAYDSTSHGSTGGRAADLLSLDPRYLTTALQLAAGASTPQERRAAQSALDSADRELDLQYGFALQLASITPVPSSPRIKEIQARIKRLDTAIATRKVQVSRLAARVAHTHGTRKSALEQLLDVRQAELSLFHEALHDAEDSLDRDGGSLQGRLARLAAEHAALSREHDSFRFQPPARALIAGSLYRKWTQYSAVTLLDARIREARQAAQFYAVSLAAQRETLKARVAAEEAQRRDWAKRELPPRRTALPASAQAESAARPASSPSVPVGSSGLKKGPSDSLIALIQQISADRIMVRLLDRRIQSTRALVSAYTRWDALVLASKRAALHHLIASFLWIVVTMAVVFFVNRIIEHLFAGLALHRKQKATLQAMLRISARLVGVIVILMILFGRPRNLSTVLGLAGAGLAIALQDFILSFLGWFILMGRHGIRVGDFVEINTNSFSGVRGEVIEITLFRTVLLETGNWNEPGHHTGRQVAFMNMYAVAGYYFNFSTSGQWLWDELEVAIPTGENPYPIMDRIRTVVAAATESQVQEAEREWLTVSTRYGTRSFSAQPAVNIRAGDTGVVVVVRYLTRADERPVMRNRLSHEIIKILHHGETLVSET